MSVGSPFGKAGSFTEPAVEPLFEEIPQSYGSAYRVNAEQFDIPWPVLAGIGKAATDHGARNPYGEAPTAGYPKVEPPIEGAGNGPMLLTDGKRDAQDPSVAIGRVSALITAELDKLDSPIARGMVARPFTEENHQKWVDLLGNLPLAWQDFQGADNCATGTSQAAQPALAGAVAPGSATGLVGASMFGSPDKDGNGVPDGGDDNGRSAYSGSNYVGYASWAELSTDPNASPLDYAALGDLPENTVLRITSPETGKSILAGKRDRGAGGKSVTKDGTTYPKKIDLWWQAAAELGLPGWETGNWSGVLEISPVEPGSQPTSLSVVNDDGTPKAGATGSGSPAGGSPVNMASAGPVLSCAPSTPVPGAVVSGGAVTDLPGGPAPSINSYTIPGFKYPLISQDEYFEDWYDAARSGGRTHQATDIMAPRGTPIVSPETGVLSQVGSNPLGGNRVWVSGGSGYHYYLAHMNAFAPGIADGVKVQAGQLLGFVGNTGTGASKTDPHLHIAIHWPEKSSKPPLNPYVVLKATPEGAAAVERGATANTSSTISEDGSASAGPGAATSGAPSGGGPGAAMNAARALYGLDPIGGAAGTPIAGTIEAAQLAEIGGMSIEAATAYIEGAKRAQELVPGCAVDPLFLAGFGKIESGHGTANGASIQPDGMVLPKILGPSLDGSGVGGNTTAISNKLPADKRFLYGVNGAYDQAVGPMQFLGSTFGGLQPPPDFDGDPSTIPTPHSYYDATLGAAILLCNAGNGLQDEASMRTAAFSYNRSSSYVEKVMGEYQRLKILMPAGVQPASGPYVIPIANTPADELDDPHHDYPAWDYAVPVGTPVMAVTGGVATRINDDSCGVGISVAGDDGGRWAFCHGSEQLVASNTRVTPGQVIMRSGNTGHSTGPHIHLGLKIDGEKRCVTDLLIAWGQGRYPPISTARTAGQAQGGTCYY